jgi:hypothetical protein
MNVILACFVGDSGMFCLTKHARITFTRPAHRGNTQTRLKTHESGNVQTKEKPGVLGSVSQ